MIPLTYEDISYLSQEVCYGCKKDLVLMMTIKNIIKFYHKEIIFHYTGKYRGTGHHICNLRCKTIKEIPVIFHICST